jgi:hypothetical protein
MGKWPEDGESFAVEQVDKQAGVTEFVASM